jgi:hypothetical protein
LLDRISHVKGGIAIVLAWGCGTRTLSEQPPERCDLVEGLDVVADQACIAGAIEGARYACSISDVRGYPDSPTEQAVPSCDESAERPCWSLVRDEVACADGEHVGVRIERDVPAASDNIVSAFCNICVEE